VADFGLRRNHVKVFISYVHNLCSLNFGFGGFGGGLQTGSPPPALGAPLLWPVMEYDLKYFEIQNAKPGFFNACRYVRTAPRAVDLLTLLYLKNEIFPKVTLFPYATNSPTFLLNVVHLSSSWTVWCSTVPL
jgi:hypothetical protein